MSSITLHPGQSRVFEDLFVNKTCRYACVVCSRGWGKSFLAGVTGVKAIFELLDLHELIPNKNVYIIAPTYSQVTDIYYPLLAYQLGMSSYASRHSRDLGRFWFPQDVNLRLVSYEAIERLRGTGAYFVVNDELSSWTRTLDAKEAWQSIIQPCINTRWSPKRAALYRSNAGRALTISTPAGYNFLYDMFNYQEQDKEWKSYHFDYTTSPFLDTNEIERIKHQIDPLKFAREYLANFEESGNNVFYTFNRKVHVISDLNVLMNNDPEDTGLDYNDFLENEVVHIGIDFNVGLQCSNAFAIRGKKVHILHEFKGLPDTDSLAKAIIGRFPGKKIHAYPDPTGNSKKTSAVIGTTDFSILQHHGIIVRAHPKSPPIVDSVNATNRMFKNAAGEVSLYIHSRCQGVITSVERTRWVENNPDTAAIDKSESIEHFSDSVRYPMHFLFPIRLGTRSTSRGFSF